MNDVQAWQATYARHERALARERKGAATPENAPPKFADALTAPRAAEARPATPPAGTTPTPAPAPPIAKPAAVAAVPVPASAPVDVTPDQFAALMSVFGDPGKEPVAPVAARATPEAPAKAPVVAAPELTPDQAALLLQSFGIAGHAYGAADVETDAEGESAAASSVALSATAPTGRFYPVTPSRQAASPDASDVYLNAMRNLDRDLARRGVR
jgi:hypothetical protein